MAKYVNSDGLQYAISKIKTLLNGKANTSHNHDITGLTNFNTAVYNATLSRTANTFLAAPNGSNGAGTFRKIVENDLPAEMANHTIPYYKSFGASSGTAGYLKIINIDMSSGTYMNQPLVFLLGQRSSGLCWLTVIFSQSNTAGSSSVSKFMKFGSDMNLYIVKTANDKFSIYAKKSEGYDSISLYGYYKGAYMANCKVTFVDEFASSVPTGYTTAGWGGRASYANSAGYTDNSLTIQTNGTTAATFNGSAAKTVNITPSSIGAAASHSHPYLPLAGGTMTGNITMSTSEAADVGIEIKNTASGGKAMALVIGSSKTNRGLYDRSGDKWMVYSDSSNVVHLNGTASQVANSMTVKLNGGTTEGTNLFTYNGSGAKTVNITPSAIGAQPKVKYGTAAPSGTANTGDIYIQYS